MELILSLWPVAVYIAVMVWFAFSEAANDAHRIKLHIAIDHGQEFTQRFLVAGVGAWSMCLFLGSWWAMVPMLTLGAFLFSAVFRARLNKLRGLHPCYVSPSNYYDYVFIAASWALEYSGRWPRKEHVTNWFLDLYDPAWTGHSTFMRVIHRGGLCAYITESTLVALSIYAVGVILNNQLP